MICGTKSKLYRNFGQKSISIFNNILKSSPEFWLHHVQLGRGIRSLFQYPVLQNF